jgi:hypothetical protein
MYSPASARFELKSTSLDRPYADRLRSLREVREIAPHKDPSDIDRIELCRAPDLKSRALERQDRFGSLQTSWLVKNCFATWRSSIVHIKANYVVSRDNEITIATSELDVIKELQLALAEKDVLILELEDKLQNSTRDVVALESRLRTEILDVERRTERQVYDLQEERLSLEKEWNFKRSEIDREWNSKLSDMEERQKRLEEERDRRLADAEMQRHRIEEEWRRRLRDVEDLNDSLREEHRLHTGRLEESHNQRLRETQSHRSRLEEEFDQRLREIEAAHARTQDELEARLRDASERHLQLEDDHRRQLGRLQEDHNHTISRLKDKNNLQISQLEDARSMSEKQWSARLRDAEEKARALEQQWNDRLRYAEDQQRSLDQQWSLKLQKAEEDRDLALQRMEETRIAQLKGAGSQVAFALIGGNTKAWRAIVLHAWARWTERACIEAECGAKLKAAEDKSVEMEKSYIAMLDKYEAERERIDREWQRKMQEQEDNERALKRALEEDKKWTKQNKANKAAMALMGGLARGIINATFEGWARFVQHATVERELEARIREAEDHKAQLRRQHDAQLDQLDERERTLVLNYEERFRRLSEEHDLKMQASDHRLKEAHALRLMREGAHCGAAVHHIGRTEAKLILMETFVAWMQRNRHVKWEMTVDHFYRSTRAEMDRLCTRRENAAGTLAVRGSARFDVYKVLYAWRHATVAVAIRGAAKMASAKWGMQYGLQRGALFWHRIFDDWLRVANASRLQSVRRRGDLEKRQHTLRVCERMAQAIGGKHFFFYIWHRASEKLRRERESDILRQKRDKLRKHVKQEMEDNFFFRLTFLIQCVFSRWKHLTANSRHYSSLEELRDVLYEQFRAGRGGRVSSVVSAIEDQRMQLAIWEAFTRWALLVRMERTAKLQATPMMSTFMNTYTPWQPQALPRSVIYQGSVAQADAITTCNVALSPGSVVLEVASIAGFVPGRQMSIDEGTAIAEVNTIQSIVHDGIGYGMYASPLVLNLASPLKFGHLAGATVKMPKAILLANGINTTTTPTSDVLHRPGQGFSPTTSVCAPSLGRTIGYRVFNTTTTTTPDASLPTATVGVDANHDGHPNFYYTGVDMNHDGIPDALQAPMPTATVGVDVNHDGRPNFFYTGVDANHDGIPDTLQVGAEATMAALRHPWLPVVQRRQNAAATTAAARSRSPTAAGRSISPVPPSPRLTAVGLAAVGMAAAAEAESSAAASSAAPLGSATSIGTLWEQWEASAEQAGTRIPLMIERLKAQPASPRLSPRRAPPTVMRATTPCRQVGGTAAAAAAAAVAKVVSSGGAIRTGSVSPIPRPTAFLSAKPLRTSSNFAA